ncbi:MAG: hypothetical protein ACRDQY_17385 [Pseudonocardiaceae bacterium]
MYVPQEGTPVRTEITRCAGFALALLMGGVTACSSTESPVPSRPSATVSPTGSTASSAEPRGTDEGILPAELLGAWESVGGDATLAYRFLPDGRYRFAALLTHPVPEGVFKVTRIESGTVRVDGRALILRPTMATTTRNHPGYPDEDYTDRPEPLTPKRHSWRINLNVLRLVDDTGLELSFDRQP